MALPQLEAPPSVRSQGTSAAGAPLLMALILLGSGGLLILGRHLLRLRPEPTPATPAAELERTRHQDNDPERRRETALLLQAASREDPARQRRLLAGQGWGRGALAPLALKLDAQAAEGLGEDARAIVLWRQLERRFPTAPATADALYALGRDDPARRLALLQRFPAHPASLAAAIELGPAAAERRRGAVHLARWGPRWPGAEAKLRQACRLQAGPLAPAERQQLAAGLAQLGDGSAAAACLAGQTADAATELSVGKALLKADGSEARRGQQRLLALARRLPASPEALEASRLLAEQPGPAGLAPLAVLPPELRSGAPVQARLALEKGSSWREVLQRWPDDPASWDLHWELSRLRLLKGQWAAAMAVLRALDPQRLPLPLAARQRFWMGFAQQRLGQPGQAEASWRELLKHSPWGYYAWRARVRLGERDPALRVRAAGGETVKPEPWPWQPLGGAPPDLARLWRLDQPLEAWEQWRHQRGNVAPSTAGELQLEGRLRQGVGDDWTGLGQLEQASIRWTGASCADSLPLEQALHPVRYAAVFAPAAAAEALDPTLLLAVAKQESRFTAGVSSAAGAVGLLQLLPDTAAELAGAPVSSEQLRRPEVNAPLGARYLRHLLKQWQGNPFAAIASYNAGPNAVRGWITPTLQRDPELWVEAIPYPETRIYVKKVLGNLWSYQELPRRRC
jgi:soluble lytic murein transglycosylase